MKKKLAEYLGSIVSVAYNGSESEGKRPFQKTTLELVTIMRAQKERLGREDINESAILERYSSQR